MFSLGRWLGHTALDDCLRDFHTTPHSSDEHDEFEAALWAAADTLDASTAASFDQQREQRDGVAAFLARLPGAIRAVTEATAYADLLAGAVARAVERHASDEIDPVQRTFEVVSRAAAEFYRAFGFGCERLRFEVAIRKSGAVHRFPAGAWVNGFTELRGRDVIVGLDLTAERFGIEEIRATPYALFHELIVHAFGHPVSRSAAGPWAEGWMDLVAAGVHRAALDGEVRWLEPIPLIGPPSLVRDAGDELHLARFKRDARDRSWRVRQLARLRAIDALTVLDRACGRGVEGGRSALWAFCVALNCSALEPYRRDEACEEIGRRLLTDATTTGAALLDCARAVMAGRDPPTRVERAVQFLLS